MLQIKTKEQVYQMAKILGLDESDVNNLDARVMMNQFEPITHLEIDKPISFDQMAAIVDYIRHCNATEHQPYISKYKEDWKYQE